MSLDVALLRWCSALLRQEVSKVNLNSGGWAWAQIIWLGLRFALFELEQLLFYHLDLLFLTLHLYSLLFLLRWRQVLFEQVRVVSVTSEDTLVVHDVESLTIVVLIIIVGVGVVGARVLELLLGPHHLGLGTLKCLSHISNYTNSTNLQ